MAADLEENWRTIPDFPDYSVSDLGRIRSEPRASFRYGLPMKNAGKILKTPPRNGYARLNVRRDGKTTQLFVHQAVMRAFVGDAPHGEEVRHLDGVPANNCLGNLCYGTRSENIADAKRHGTFPLLENRPRAKLTRAQAIEIVSATSTAAELAAIYGISTHTIAQIRGGKTWGSVTEEFRRASYRPAGSASLAARLNKTSVRAIAGSALSDSVLAARFGVSKAAIWRIRSGKTWKDVTGL